MTDSRLILLGASIRSPAQSAALSQIPTWGADLFADTDTCAVSIVQRVNRYPHDLLTCAEQAARSVWMYGGALENHPEIVERLSKTHALAGNPADVLEKVRDLTWLAEQARHCGLHTPHTIPAVDFDRKLHRGRWLSKPIGSSAGLGICELTQRASSPNDAPGIAQQYVSGTAGSCVFLSSVDRTDSDCRVMGITHSIQPRSPSETIGPCDFRYRGSFGPCDLLAPDRFQLLEDFGDRVTQTAKIRGLWCVDFVENQRGLWLLEINPRWSASMEILERHSYGPLIPQHLRACQPTMPDWAQTQIDRWLSRGPSRSAPKSVMLYWGKRIVYSDRPRVVDTMFSDAVERMQPPPENWPLVADLPPVGTRIAAGRPLCTLFATTEDVSQLETMLLRLEGNLLEAAGSVL